jgi:hypothetical protein
VAGDHSLVKRASTVAILSRRCWAVQCHVVDATVTHDIDVSLFPNWQGRDQVRRVSIEG